jgi:hypothetical protein
MDAALAWRKHASNTHHNRVAEGMKSVNMHSSSKNARRWNYDARVR